MKKVIKIVIVVIVLALLVLGYYYYLSSRNSAPAEETTTKKQVSELNRIVEKDFEKDYPRTPRAVVKWYNRIITEYYAKKHSDKDIEKLAMKARSLFDEDLQKKNPKDQFIDQVKEDIANYRKRKASIVTTQVVSSNDVRYGTVKGRECAYVDTYYFSKEGSTYTRTYQEFCLRKDPEGRWKILTWRVVKGDPEEFS